MRERHLRGKNARKLEQVARSQQPPLTVPQFLQQEYALKSDAVIAHEHGVSPNSVTRLRRHYHIPAHKPGDLITRRVSPDEEKRRSERGKLLGARNNKMAFSETEDITDGLQRRLQQGASWEAIAQEAGVSVPAIKSRVQRLDLPHTFPKGGEQQKIATIMKLRPIVQHYYETDGLQRLETSPDEALQQGAIILRERYLVADPREGKTYQQLSQILGCSYAKVRQLQHKALAAYEKDVSATK